MTDVSLESMPVTKRETADYICRMLQEFTRMAKEEKLAMLTYLLEMATEEAMSIRDGAPPSAVALPLAERPVRKLSANLDG